MDGFCGLYVLSAFCMHKTVAINWQYTWENWKLSVGIRWRPTLFGIDFIYSSFLLVSFFLDANGNGSLFFNFFLENRCVYLFMCTIWLRNIFDLYFYHFKQCACACICSLYFFRLFHSPQFIESSSSCCANNYRLYYSENWNGMRILFNCTQIKLVFNFDLIYYHWIPIGVCIVCIGRHSVWFWAVLLG